MNKKSASQYAYDQMKKIKRDKNGCPATLEGAIKHMILKNSDMFQYRDDALNTLYCVLGTGISWNDKRLVDRTPNNYLNLPPDYNGQGIWSRDFGMAESFEFMSLGKVFRTEILDRQISELRDAIITIQDIDERVQTYRNEHTRTWYPISWYACNLCVPKTAQKDFRDGAIEVITLILNSKPQVGTQQWLDHQRTKAYAEEILIALKEHQKPATTDVGVKRGGKK